MGLPHVVVRFYTSPHGVAARRTTVAVLGLIGAFYLLPPLYGALGRLYAPELTLTGDADAAVLLLPDRVIGGVGGDLLGALVAGGAFAAFLSTASGLTMAVAGVLTQDVLPSRAVPHFRLGTLLAMAVPLAASALVGGLPVADAVGWPSPCPPPPSARCSSSASGGGRLHPARRGRRDAGGRRLGPARRRRDHGRLPGRRRIAARAAGLARPVVGAAGLPHHGAGLPGHPRPGAGRDGGDPGPLRHLPEDLGTEELPTDAAAHGRAARGPVARQGGPAAGHPRKEATR
ncbi:Cation acetate symporter OS=Streptomyces tendae OX=1932 GN=GUR47_29655 PE=3 SV=1 [Streptomyces tendae]